MENNFPVFIKITTDYTFGLNNPTSGDFLWYTCTCANISGYDVINCEEKPPKSINRKLVKKTIMVFQYKTE